MIEREKKVEILKKNSEMRQFVGGRASELADSAAAVMAIHSLLLRYRQCHAQITGDEHTHTQRERETERQLRERE